MHSRLVKVVVNSRSASASLGRFSTSTKVVSLNTDSKATTKPDKPKKSQIDFSQDDLIGPPDSVSNIRPLIIQTRSGETPLQRRYRELQLETAEFNHRFWTEHNNQFKQEKEAFVERYSKEKYPLETNKKNLSADEMSEFYKSFLDRKLADHSTYNLQWQIRNFKIVCLSIAVSLEKLFKW